jgi:hypothetical protein
VSIVADAEGVMANEGGKGLVGGAPLNTNLSAKAGQHAALVPGHSASALPAIAYPHLAVVFERTSTGPAAVVIESSTSPAAVARTRRNKNNKKATLQSAAAPLPLVGNAVHQRTRIEFDAIDIIAFCSGVVALMFAVAMIAGWVAIDTLTISIVTFAVVGPAVAKAVQARGKKKSD